MVAADAKQDGDRKTKQFLCIVWKKRNARPNVGGVSNRSRNGVPSRQGCVVNGQMTKKAKNAQGMDLIGERRKSGGQLSPPRQKVAFFLCAPTMVKVAIGQMTATSSKPHNFDVSGMGNSKRPPPQETRCSHVVLCCFVFTPGLSSQYLLLSQPLRTNPTTT